MVPGIHTDGQSVNGGQGGAKTKVAIVGTGLAGLHANYLLQQQSDKYEVHLFEQSETLGLDASSITTEDGIRIDVPMRSLNSGYYPNLVQLYRSLGVRLRKSEFTFSFAVSHSPTQPFLLYNGMSGLRGISMPKIATQNVGTTRNLRQSYARQAIAYVSHARLCTSFVCSYVCLLFFALYHHALGHLLDPGHPLSSEPLGRWTSRHPRALHPAFVHAVLFSLFSAVGTSSYEAIERMPAAELLLYVAVTFLRSHYVVDEGVQAVQRALTRNSGADRKTVHLASTVNGIEHDPLTGCARLSFTSSSDARGRECRIDGFQHIILACPANFSSNLLQTYARSLSSSHKQHARTADQLENVREMSETLSRVQYERSTVINHSDTSLLPNDPVNRRDLNIVCPSPSSTDPFDKDVVEHVHARSSSTATHVVRSTASKVILQTTNPTVRPDPDTIISEATFVRAMTPASKSTLNGLFEWRATNVSTSKRLKMLLLRRRRNDESYTIRSDWISSYLELLFGRRWSQSLGRNHERQIERIDGKTPTPVAFWACGSYAHGIPLLEGCVTSSTLVVDGIHRARRAAQKHSLSS